MERKKKNLLPKTNRSEFAGAFGDLPLLFPLLSAYVVVCHINPVPALIILGLACLGCGIYYQLPIPVQPLKVFAAIAIAQKLSPQVVFAGGLLMGIIFLTLSFSPFLLKRLTKVFPVPVVLGVQFSIGLLLFRVASELIFTRTLSFPGEWKVFLNPDLLLVATGGLILLFFSKHQQIPAALLVIILLGVCATLAFGSPFLPPYLQSKGYPGPFFLPSLADFKKASWLLVVPQVPLTLGNSLVATVDAARFYFGPKAKRVTLRNLSFSLGFLNILSGLFGGIPICHGSNGLTAHYRFGARSGRATVILGLIFLSSVFLFGDGIKTLFNLVPFSLFGVLLFYVAFQHALLARRVVGWKEAFVVLAIGLTTLITGNLAGAALVGIVVYFCLINKNAREPV